MLNKNCKIILTRLKNGNITLQDILLYSFNIEAEKVSLHFTRELSLLQYCAKTIEKASTIEV